ncbi:NAD(P)-dependent dehydrogenase (short-subunit alcohol dehydrogenase family) [Roseibium hamelinense]|uniref:NAD(P)-dependent dehydrogenase (Short-subunit alcohol dehydrogenase family) n=1 Tax=Roseibium hamelinense TaxID=150831 RepID=A0A562TJK6_9HYPH|nr:SDR family NAD(P)-dependent oxidoreductase [Roseibium hamelinense]MTI42335.1 SDR family NAD(P)-dependent oxidoreductase [Roseibium hamelinense]TWI93256.1 NAD(P)-dependent dehydrogenase (short-subunit alcohol dehydrogenase family) [Roseibium hamelinense]
MQKDFEGRVALVTGASRGIGYQLAKNLGARGAHVIALARTVGGLEELDDEIQQAGGESATLVPVDLKDFGALDRLGAAIYKRWKKLDVLIGNAAMLGTLSPIGHIKVKTFDEALATNVTANWRLMRSMDALLRQSDAGRALFLTAAQAHSCTPFWGIQSTTKAALEALVRTYAAETEKAALNVNLADPGPVRTGLRAKAMPGEDPSTLATPEDVAPALVNLVSAQYMRTGCLYDRLSDDTLDLLNG